ncbi:MAG: hypothetical protein WCP52_13700 [Bacteroidota bacterium]
MKKILLITSLLLFMTASLLKAQTYRELYDKLEQTEQEGFSYYSNFNSLLQYEGYYYMQSYINMYKATKDIKYLNKLVIHAKRVMDRRDDNIMNVSANQIPRWRWRVSLVPNNRWCPHHHF